jgi:DNA-binding winged helix-turn-helix (wHTH) protein
VDATATARLVWLTHSHDVAVLRWPEEADEAARLDRQGSPRLLLVEYGAIPPTSGSCLEDWLVLPASDAEVEARLVNLARRAEHHPRPPTIDAFGQLTYRGRSRFLSPVEQRLAQTLIDSFGAIVGERELRKKVWSDEATEQRLRVHVSRLRRRLLPIDLTIKCVRNAGYLITGSAALDPCAEPAGEVGL